MIELNVNVKSISNKKNKIKTIKIPYNDDVSDVRALIMETVKYCVESYNQRAENVDVLSVFSKEQIDDKAMSGKIAFGVNYGENKADLQKAEDDAIEAFNDGVAVLLIDDERAEELDQKIDLKNIGSLTFIKLIMLAGRMW